MKLRHRSRILLLLLLLLPLAVLALSRHLLRVKAQAWPANPLSLSAVSDVPQPEHHLRARILHPRFAHQNSSTHASYIPNFILRTWKSSERHVFAPQNCSASSSRVCEWFHSWESLNPTHVQILFDDADSMRFVRGFFSQSVVSAYLKLPRAVMRADLVRYLMLYWFGGIYTDMDTLCVKPIWMWMKAVGRVEGWEGVGVVVGVENARGNKDNINQWTIASAAFHPLLAIAITRVVDTIHSANESELLDPAKLLYITGPGIWKPVVHEYLANLGAKVDDVSFLWDGFRMFGDVVILGKTHLSSSNEENPKTLSRHFGTGKMEGGWKQSHDPDVSDYEHYPDVLLESKVFEHQIDTYAHPELVERIELEQRSLTRKIDIPKNIAQVFYSADETLLNGSFAKQRSSWLQKNAGYTYKLFDDEGMANFVKKHGNDAERKAFLRAGLLHQRYALFKFLWLVKVGGVFSDVDTECLHPIDTWRMGDSHVKLVLGIQNQSRTPFPVLAKHTIMAAPNDPLLSSFLKTLVQHMTSMSKKQLRAQLSFKILHNDWFENHVYNYMQKTSKKTSEDLALLFSKLSWESRVFFGHNAVLYGQGMMRPDDLDRKISLTKNFGQLWVGNRTWATDWPDNRDTNET
ncbi:hypothetical protein HDU83_004743 [Entophlyctis luteolus]|nr:hypothetical protein HDU83_004743 [Entophlyctis luteolus]